MAAMRERVLKHALATVLVLGLTGCATLLAPTATDVVKLAPAHAAWPAGVAAPKPAQRPHPVVAPGGTRIDPYYWMRDDTRLSPEVLGHLAAENAYVDAMTAPLDRFESRLFEEMRGRIDESDVSAPVFDNGWWYYTRFEQGQEYPVHARRQGSLDAPEQVLLDGNVMAQGHEYFAIGRFAVSPDNRWLAYSVDTVGRRKHELRVRRIDSGQDLPDVIPLVQGDLAWLNDNATLLYTEIDPVTLLGYRVRAHRVGEPPAQDVVVYTERDSSYFIGVSRSKSGRHVFVNCTSTLSTEQLFAPADGLPLAFAPVLPRVSTHEYSAELHGEEFVIRSNENAPNFRVVRTPIARRADRSAWTEVVPHRADALVEGFDVFRTHLAINERSGGLLKVRVLPWDAPQDGVVIAADEPAYTATLQPTPSFDSPSLRYVYESLTTPATVIDQDLATGARSVRKVEAVLGGFDARTYRTEYLHAPARDGTAVPVSLVRHRDTPLDGSAPLFVYGYGAYGASVDPQFDSERLSLLDRGFVFALIHVRGGQELGRAWYEGGRLLNKRNTFTDFIDATDALVARGYGAKQLVFAHGGSAGGLLMGAIANLAPEKYRGIITVVPFVDVVTTMLDESIPLTTNEFDEWGNPKEPRYYEYMLGYSPYDNIAPRDYPAIYVGTGLWDSQVQYFEPAKWVARLRDADRTPETPVLFRVNLEAGHSGSSGRFARLRETAERYAFALSLAGRHE